jgi:peptidoglycan hydrolase CwlO-like protein
MTGKRTMTFIVKSYIFFSIVLFISACSSTKLIEIDKTSNFLNLSEEQLKVVQPKIETIKIIVDKYNAEKEKLDTELQKLRGSRMGGGGFGGPPPGGSGGGQGGPRREEVRQKIQALREKQSKSQTQIDALVADIKDVLNKEQLEKFEKIKLPKLEMPEFGGGQQRGGGRMGGGGRGGPGGGGGFPPL